MGSPTDEARTFGRRPSAHDGGHVVQFYDDDLFLCEVLTDFAGAGVAAGDAVIVIATAPHRQALRDLLSARGVDVDVATRAGQLILLDAREGLARFMVDGVPSSELFTACFHELLALAASNGRGARIYGEMVDLLWREGNRDAAICLEEMGNAFVKAHPTPLLCGYAMDNFVKASDAGGFLRVCDVHTDVRPAESYPRAQPEGARLREVALLQQRARALEGELRQRHQLEVTLRQALDREQAAHRAKDQFLAMLGHELRNPLGVIALSLEVIAPQLGNAVANERGVIADQVQQLVRLVDDLLDAARLAHGKVQLNKEPIGLADVVARATELARPLIESKRHALEISLPTPDLIVEADRLRLAQAVGNVVANAAKYTGPGGRLQITGETRDGRVLLRIADNGMGIAVDLLPRVFDPFVQGARGLDRSEGGLGMGLTVAKQLIELHDGTISASSAGEGQGSDFTISLPPATRPKRAPAVPTAAVVQAVLSAKPLKVLVVDDNVHSARVVGDIVRLMGHEVTVVHDALAALLVTDADVAVLDIGLPGMDGYELARHIRERGRAPQMFLVALTGYGEDGHRARSRDAGFDAHMVKPLDLEAMRAVLDRVRSGA